MDYTVYMHENRVNGKKYIGITCQKPEKRWKNGYGYQKNKHFFSAIQKYGWDMFDHKILFVNLNKGNAEAKEIELIDKYKSNNREYGYNIDNGGNHLGHFSEEHNKKISESKKGKKLSEYHLQKLREAWKHRKPMSEESKKNISKGHMKKVICIETGKVFNSAKEATEKAGLSRGCISGCCRGRQKTAGGLHWEYYKEV